MAALPMPPPPRAAFSRRQPERQPDLGTRPGLHGHTLISTGLADLDRLLGGGLPLGSLLLVQEDQHSQQHLNFLRYFIAEGAVCKHSVLWLAPQEPAGGAAAFLPDQARASSGIQATTSQPAGRTAGQQEAAADSELRIAWQYRKYIQQQQQQHGPLFLGARATARGSSEPAQPKTSSFVRKGSALEAGLAREWCHQFDLTKPMGQEALQASRLRFKMLQGQGAMQEACSEALAFIDRLQQQKPLQGAALAGALPAPPPSSPQTVGRLVLQSLGSAAWAEAPGGSQPGMRTLSLQQQQQQQLQQMSEASLLRGVSSLRRAAQDTRCAALLTCAVDVLSKSCAARLRHLCDAVVSVETLADDSEVFQLLPDQLSASALLHVLRLPGMNLQRHQEPEQALHVIRHKRRAIRISAVEVDPDAEERQAHAAGSAVPAAALLCGGPPAAAKALDF